MKQRRRKNHVTRKNQTQPKTLFQKKYNIIASLKRSHEIRKGRSMCSFQREIWQKSTRVEYVTKWSKVRDRKKDQFRINVSPWVYSLN